MHPVYIPDILISPDSESCGNIYILLLYVCDTGISEEEKCRLLHCVVVGGGPTGVEFSGELSDFIMKDVRQRYAHVKDYIHVTLIEVWFTEICFCCLLDMFQQCFPLVLCHHDVFFIFQANEILSSFDDRLRIYATKQLTKVRHGSIVYVLYILAS